MSATVIALLAATGAGAVIDVRSRKIPNLLTGGTALLALILQAPQGAGAELVALASMLAAFAIGSLAYSAGWFGGGDVKLIAACCALIPFPAGIALVLDILVAGALLALVTAAAQGRLLALVRSTAVVAARGAPVEKIALPYGVAIAAGSVAYAVMTFISS